MDLDAISNPMRSAVQAVQAQQMSASTASLRFCVSRTTLRRHVAAEQHGKHVRMGRPPILPALVDDALSAVLVRGAERNMPLPFGELPAMAKRLPAT